MGGPKGRWEGLRSRCETLGMEKDERVFKSPQLYDEDDDDILLNNVHQSHKQKVHKFRKS